ncbi:endopeptidase [Mangrovibacter sp. MFB070]|uniref:DUF2501 domain-containing protein n=1 Tax=Mangrovibacter sp. MFB070 TaxID=1224318 RepID=UPI0004D6D209|nr:DUF2501 domain-containing protein [Mangrovibacter sp. MFB070]KEA53292.1 endopeptidase [Mangrovibacter sp. MFB070]
MSVKQPVLLSLALAFGLVSATASAVNLQQLSSSAEQLMGSSSGSTSANSTSSLTSLLGSSNSLSAGNMNNAAGVLQYCMKQKLVNATSADNVKNQLLNKLGLENQSSSTSQDYQQGLAGLLNSKEGQQINLDSLGNSELGKKVKTKACDLVLKQGASFIS